MLGALRHGDAGLLAELMRQDPGFNVNEDQDREGGTFLHYACNGDRRSAAIPLLLARPDIDVNAKNRRGYTPFYYACSGRASCVREMLKDPRVKVNEPADNGWTPLWRAAVGGYIDIIKWWIASGREMDLGKPGDVDKTDAIGAAKKNGKTEVVALLERFKENPDETRHAMRVELGLLDEMAAGMFALVVFVSDGLLQIDDTMTATPAARFFSIAKRLPLEIQMVLCFRQVGSPKDNIQGRTSEVAFKELARKLW